MKKYEHFQCLLIELKYKCLFYIKKKMELNILIGNIKIILLHIYAILYPLPLPHLTYNHNLPTPSPNLQSPTLQPSP